jgi:hypothetical protein
MCRNLREFLDLQQGTDNVYEYIEKFNYLAQYGTYHVDTDEKKTELFRRGLSLPLQDRLVRFQDMSFNALVSAAINQDGTYRALLAEVEEKRKRDLSQPLDDSTKGAPSKYCPHGTVHLTTGSLTHTITMPDDIEVAALHARLEAIIKEAEDIEAQAATVRHCVQAARLLLEEEESKAAALEQMGTATRQCVSSSSSSSSSPTVASQLVPTASSTYKDMVVAGLHLQAAAVLNIRQLVNIVLDSSSTNYTSWRDLMEQALQRYTLIKHITDDALSNDSRWIQMDNIVLNWVSNSILANLQQVVRERGCTTRHL